MGDQHPAVMSRSLLALLLLAACLSPAAAQSAECTASLKTGNTACQKAKTEAACSAANCQWCSGSSTNVWGASVVYPSGCWVKNVFSPLQSSTCTIGDNTFPDSSSSSCPYNTDSMTAGAKKVLKGIGTAIIVVIVGSIAACLCCVGIIVYCIVQSNKKKEVVVMTQAPGMAPHV